MLELMSQYPGVIPSVLLGIVLVFWALTILGLLDFEGFGPDWLGEGGADDAAMPETLMALGYHRTPFSVVVSAIGLLWWVFTLLGMQWLAPLLPLPLFLIGSMILIAALIGAAIAGAYLVRPLRPLFRVHVAARAHDLVGRPCRILTLTVDDAFGQAEVNVDGGAPLNVKVFHTDGQRFTKGDVALILAWDPERERYRIGPLELGLELKALKPPSG